MYGKTSQNAQLHPRSQEHRESSPGWRFVLITVIYKYIQITVQKISQIYFPDSCFQDRLADLKKIKSVNLTSILLYFQALICKYFIPVSHERLQLLMAMQLQRFSQRHHRDNTEILCHHFETFSTLNASSWWQCWVDLSLCPDISKIAFFCLISNKVEAGHLTYF